jgi:peptidoglycan hydrolase-like protein with peptidoglycan-binding domain
MADLTDEHLALLRTIDPTVEADGPTVAGAIMDFQTLAGLEPTGKWNQATAEAADATIVYAEFVAEAAAHRPQLQVGDSGPAVKDLQRAVQATVSGVFDSETLRRVKRVQGAHGMARTGVVDADLWEKLATS